MTDGELVLGERGAECGEQGDFGEWARDWLLFTADDTAWANRDGVVGQNGLGAAKLRSFSKLRPAVRGFAGKLLCLVIFAILSSLGLSSSLGAPEVSSRDFSGNRGGGGGEDSCALSEAPLRPDTELLLRLFSAADVT